MSAPLRGIVGVLLLAILVFGGVALLRSGVYGTRLSIVVICGC